MSPPQIPGYQMNSCLGQGAFGSVYEAMWNGDFPCALKLLEAGALHREYLAMVLERLMELEPHEGLLPLYAFDLEGEVPHLSMALLPRGAVTFDDLAGQLTRDEAWSLLGPLAESLAWLHSHGLVHAGLTGGNVFVVANEEGNPMTLLTDVGQAWLGDGLMERLHDQAPYVPPERWRDPGRVLQDGHAETWDVYAFGVLAWRLLNGRWPRANKLFDRVLSSKGEQLTVDPLAFAEWLAKEKPPVWPDQSRDAAGKKAREVVQRCLSLDPADRPASMVQVAAALREFTASRAALNSAKLTAPGNEPLPVPVPPTNVAPEPVLELWAVQPTEPDLPEAILAPDPVPVAFSVPVEVQTPEIGDQEKAAAWTPVAKPDFSGIFAPSGTMDPLRELAGGRETDGSAPLPPVQPALVRDSPAEGQAFQAAAHGTSRQGRIGPRLAAAAAIMLGVAGAVYAQQQKRLAGQWQRESAEAAGQAGQARAQAGAAAEQIRILEEDRASRRLAALAQARDEWAGVVAEMQLSRPVEPAALEAWRPAVAPVAGRLKTALAAAEQEPSLVAGSMEPRWQLASLYEMLAKPDEALPLLEHLALDLEATAATASSADGSRGLLKARVSSRRGAILLDARRPMDAAPLLQEASASYESWLTTHPDRHDIAREYAVNSLLEGQALMERRQPEPARTALARIAGLLGKPEDAGFLPEDHFTLTDTLLLVSAMDSDAGRLEPAIEQHMQAVRLLVAYDQNNRQSIPCRRRLADGYFGLGRLLTKNGTPRDASVAFSEAVKLLTELSKESPSEPFYRLQLALTYDEVAQLIRTSRPNPAGAREALEYQNGSVTIVRNLNETNTLDNSIRRQLTAALVLNGELQELAGDPKASLARHTEALALANELLGETTLSDSDRRECRRLSARAWTATGGLQEKSGRKEEAIASLNKALEAWSGFAGDDPAADKIVASTRERLRKLKPES